MTSTPQEDATEPGCSRLFQPLVRPRCGEGVIGFKHVNSVDCWALKL